MMLKNRFCVYATLFMLFSCIISCNKNRTYVVLSPDGRLGIEVGRMADSWGVRFRIEDELVIDSSLLGYRLKDGSVVPNANWTVVNQECTSVKSEWRPLWGKRAVVPDCYNQLTINLQNNVDTAGLQLMRIEIRMYDDGLAFRYVIPEGKEQEAAEELTEFNFVSDPVAWFYNGENANYGPVCLSDVHGVRPSNVTLKVTDSLYMNIHEACLTAGDPLCFASESGERILKVASSAGVFGKLGAGYTSAWRVLMIGAAPGKLVDSHLLELLNPAPEDGLDFSWVKPGMAVWDWRINGAQWDGFTYSMSYPSWIRMVDFAAEQGFNYLVLDANWYGPEFDKTSHPTEGDKADDVQRLLSYAKEKGLGIWLYLNDVGGRQYPIEETLKQYADWGAAGVKYGFMSGTPEEKNLWTQKITQICAKYHLLVDYHDGPVHPYGQMRTWPNAVTREFCHAQLDAHRVFTPTTFCTSVFVNMVAGPVDMNNGMFDLRQGNTTRVDENQPVPSTLVSEAARTLIVFSGVTILPDIPEYYKKYPELLDFIASQKMPWKESRTLAGEIGEYIVMMRQANDGVYLVGMATNECARTIDLPLSFLEDGVYAATIMEDGECAHYLTNREVLNISNRQVTRQDTLVLHLAEGGGACLKFEKQTK